MSMDTGHPTHPLFKSMKREGEDSPGEVRVLSTPQLMGILATRIGGKIRSLNTADLVFSEGFLGNRRAIRAILFQKTSY